LPHDPAIEIARHPIINAKAVRETKNFSSAGKLALGASEFPGFRMLFQFDQDEFGFTRESAMEHAASHGVVATTLRGTHNHPLRQPDDTLRQISEYLNALDFQPQE